MQNIHVKRLDCPEHQGMIEPEDGSWVVYVDKCGMPQTMVRVKYEADDGTVQEGYMDVLEAPPDMSLKELSKGVFGGKLTAEEESEARAEYEERQAKRRAG